MIRECYQRLARTPIGSAARFCQSLFFDVHATRSYSQEGEDLVLRRLFGEKAMGFYVDVGAHHPRRFSNTCLFYRLGWRGINIEPNPVAIRQFRRERPGDINLQIGIAEKPGSATYYEFDEPALNTFSRDMVDERLQHTGYRVIGSRQIPLLRLDQVIREHLTPSRPIDFLSVDVEGTDLSVLKSNDWHLFRPTCVLAEILGAASLEDALSGELARFMQEREYVMFAKTVNTVFFLDRQK